jgi:hydroxymethylglutaryl-CoA synthase
VRGIIGSGAHLPHHRLQRAAISAVHGGGGGKGTRAVASYDEDTTTMGVAAARLALHGVGAAAAPGGPAAPTALWFATTAPAYLDKTNATTIHAALRLDPSALAADFGGAVRSSVAALSAALRAGGPTLVVASDLRTGLPNGPDEREGGDAAAAVLIGDEHEGAPVLAHHLATASATEEFLDRWRVPGEPRSRLWEERFGELHYVALGEQAWAAALKAAGLEAGDVATVAVCGPHSRAVGRVATSIAAAGPTVAAGLTERIGQTGAAHPLLALTALVEEARPGQVVGVVSLADGADVLLFRATDAVSEHRPAASVADQLAAGDDRLPYAKFLSWRGQLTVEPPRRPEPARASASAAARNADWKFGFVGSRDRSSGALHLPPARVSYAGGATDEMERAPMADALGTVVTFTVDRLAYSPSPPIVFAVVDFDGGGRLPVELTDVDPDGVRIGDRVELTFRLLNVADGIRNYFWKARPRPAVARDEQPTGEV